jgi:hypothetical protein
MYADESKISEIPPEELQAVHEAAQTEAAVEKVDEETPAPTTDAPTSAPPAA